LELAAHIESKPAGSGIAAGAGVVVESVLVRPPVVVDDRRAEMKAVAQRRTADGARNGVDRLDAGVALVRQAGALGVVAQFMHQRIVNILCLVCGRSSIRVLNTGAGLLDHVAHAGAGPRTNAEKDIVHKAERVKAQHSRIDPAIDRNVGGTERGGIANLSRTTRIASRLSRTLGRSNLGGSRLFSRDWVGGHQKKSCQHGCALDNRSYGRISVHVHTHLSYSPVPDRSMNEPLKNCVLR